MHLASLIPVIALVAIFAWFRCVQLMLTMPQHKRADLTWQDVPHWGNRLNIILSPQCLTDKGKQQRKWLIRYTLLFILLICIPLTLSALTGEMNLKR